MLAVLLVLVCGIVAATAATASTVSKNYKYTYSWQTHSRMLTPRSDGTATSTGDNIIIAGGCVGKQVKTDWGYGCNEITDTVSSFNPTTTKFTALANMPRKRYRHTSVFVKDNIYVLGGTNLDYPEPVLAEIDVFDVKLKTWSTLNPNLNLPFATTDPASFVIGSTIYYTGGYETNHYTSFNKTWALDTQNLADGWKAVAAAPSERGDCVAVTIKDVGYVFGGFTHYDEFSQPVGSLESYSAVDNKWTTLNSMPTARGDKAGAVLNGRFHVIGGETKIKAGENKGHSVPIKDVEVYDPVEQTWQAEGQIPSERFRFMAAAYDGTIYIFGGQLFLIGDYGKDGSYYPVSDQVEAFVEKKIGISDVDAANTGSIVQVSSAMYAVAVLVAVVGLL